MQVSPNLRQETLEVNVPGFGERPLKVDELGMLQRDTARGHADHGKNLKQKQVGPGNLVEPPFDQSNQTCAYDSDALDIHLQQLYSDRAALLHILQMPCAFRSEPPLLSTSKRNLVTLPQPSPNKQLVWTRCKGQPLRAPGHPNASHPARATGLGNQVKWVITFSSQPNSCLKNWSEPRVYRLHWVGHLLQLLPWGLIPGHWEAAIFIRNNLQELRHRWLRENQIHSNHWATKQAPAWKARTQMKSE